MEDLNTSDVGSGSGDAFVSSTNTSLSGLTGYEEEFNDLKFLACPATPTSPQYYRNIAAKYNDTTKLLYETKIKNLTSELDDALRLNEKLKNDLFAKETKYEEANQKKINTLITRNAHVEAHLTAVRSHIDGLLKQCLPTKSLIHANASLYDQIKLIQNEIIRCNSDRNTNELLIKNIKSELASAKEEVQTRVVCVNELKKKVSEQYGAIESVLQYNKELESKLKAIGSELDWCKKSENWYKDQLNNARSKHMETSEQMIKLQQLLLEKDQDIQKVNIEVSKWKCAYEELQALFKKEKDALLNKIQSLQLETINATPILVNNPICQTCTCSDEAATRDIEEQLPKLKENLEGRQYKELQMEKANLLAQVAHLQKNLNEEKLIVQKLEQQKIELQNELLTMEQNQTKEMLTLRGSNDALQIKVFALEREKMEVENAIGFIRQDLSKVMAAHTQLRENICQKDKTIIDLQMKIQEFVRNDCEIDSLKCKAKKVDAGEVKKNKTHDNNACNELKVEVLKDTIVILENTVSELERRYESAILEKENLAERMQNSLFQTEQENDKLTGLLQEQKLSLLALENDKSWLKSALDEKEVVIKSLNEEIFNLKAESLQNLKKQEEEFKLNDEREESIVEILQLITDRLHKIEDGILCKEDVNIEVKALCADSKSFLLLQNVMRTLFNLDTKIRENVQEPTNQKLQYILLSFNDFLCKKTRFLLEKCNTLDNKVKDCCQTFNSIKEKVFVPGEEVVKLKAQELQLKEKLKRYEINNHTLLRKVKEHMKARNAAEKQHSQLQTLYNLLNETHAALNYEINTKKTELEQSNMLIANLKLHIIELQESLFNLEKQVMEQKIENDMLNKTIIEKENSVYALQQLLAERNVDVDNCKNLLLNLERQFKEELSDITRQSRATLEAEKKAKKECEQLRNSETYNRQQNLEITNKLRAEVQRLNNDRWFLKRLCNDLRCALQASVNEIEVLKAEKIRRGLPDLMSNLPIPSQCNDVLIKELIKRNQILCAPLAAVIEAPLKSLKSELNYLQECVKKQCRFADKL